ncbi:MAG TPA: hypothetical protein VGI80_06165 [Pyrinomonadaceae bacterium]
MTHNQRSIGGLTAYLSCRCSKEALSFDRGYLRLKESNKIGMWRGSRNSQVWSNATCFNYADPTDGGVYGYLWNDSSGKQNACWALNVGYRDVNDENNFARVLRWESDYSDDTLASRAEYDDWTTLHLPPWRRPVILKSQSMTRS